MTNMSIAELENEILREKYKKLKYAASILVREAELNVPRTKKRELMFMALDAVKSLTAR